MTTLPIHRFSVDDYHRMVDAGILGKGDRVELIHGEIIDMSPIGPEHNAIVMDLIEWAASAARGRYKVSSQGSIELSDSEPQPDLLLLRPRSDRYRSHRADPADVLLLVEVSDTSIDHDRNVKLPLYANEGIAEYWIVDIADRSLTVHRNPEGDAYADVRRFTADDTVAPAAFADLTLKVATLFPG